MGLLLWLFNTTAAYVLAPADSFELLEGIELDANIVVFLILIVTNASRFGPLLMERDEVPIKESGILFGCLAVQVMTLISVSLMILFPTPVLIEPVTGNRVHLARWAEWISLSFMMTFLTEAIDIPLQDAEEQAAQEKSEGSEHWVGSSAMRTSWWHAAAISVSTAAGPMYAFAYDVNSWLMIYTVSMVLFSSIYVRLFLRWRRLLKAKKGSTVDSVEAYDRCRLSFRLMLCCCLSWTGLGLGLTWGWSLHFLYPPDSAWRKEGVFMVIESFFEGSSKVWYLMVLLHINEAVFDEPMRAVRRLEALRTMMSAVWDNSSDVMVLCLPHSTKTGHVKAIISPAFSDLEETAYRESSSDSKNKSTSGRFAFLLEVEVNPKQDATTTPVHRAFALDLGKPITRFDVRKIQISLQDQVSNLRGKSSSIRSKNLDCMARLIAQATLTSSLDNQGSLLMHDMFGRGPDGREQKVRFEGKVTKLETQAVLVVLRDISERFQRFEAEKRLIQEITERRKDAEANRFTRHEVKNGLLAAIAMVESLRDEIFVRPDFGQQQQFSVNADHAASSSDEHNEKLELTSNCTELYLTLNEILETILDEAMSRDVVHERYQLQRQRIHVSQILSQMRQRSAAVVQRFPIVLAPDPFPELIIDPQLFRYIHRNAISNACRYGKKGGVVTTKVSFHGDWLQLEVINLPGDKHEKLVELGEMGASRVFLPGTRLHRGLNADVGEEAFSHATITSAGDGAWIMKKCAKSLGGECSIRFETHQTVFQLRCPVVAEGNSHQRINSTSQTFHLPKGTFGIVIDDSGVQRKLMDRFLDLIGIEKAKRVILGKDAGEIFGFGTFLEKIIQDHPACMFLVLVDENLDLVDGVRHQTVSGSQLILQVRRNLAPSDEARMLALVRSANDSAEDVALYKSRAHGFISKAPLKKDGVMQMIEPLWKERFPAQPAVIAKEIDYSNSQSGDEFVYTPTAEDLMKTIEAIDALCLVMRSTEAIDALCLSNRNYSKEGTLSDLWPAVREELHKLKGDLKSLSTSSRMDFILTSFDSLKAKSSPEEVNERWKTIRSQILAII